MWTEEHRRTYRREGEGYPSDLRDAEWARLEPLIPKASPGGRPRKTDMRAAMNAILYLLRTGCPWRYLPHDGFPPRATVYNIFRKFQDSKVRLSGASRANPARHFASAICPFGELVLPARKHLTGVPRSPSGGCPDSGRRRRRFGPPARARRHPQ